MHLWKRYFKINRAYRVLEKEEEPWLNVADYRGGIFRSLASVRKHKSMLNMAYYADNDNNTTRRNSSKQKSVKHPFRKKDSSKGTALVSLRFEQLPKKMFKCMKLETKPGKKLLKGM